MTIITVDKPFEASRAKRLQATIHETHERLDTFIMAADPFTSRDRYALFVMVQHQFHRDIDSLYRNPGLYQLFPDLAGRRRLGLIEQDLTDLGVVPAILSVAEFRSDGNVDVPTALGWLYVAEGSNLGAAFLLKEAGKLGLSETFGARHLAAAPEGRGLHWKTFTAALDGPQLTEAEEGSIIDGARAAFVRVQGLVEELLVVRTTS